MSRILFVALVLVVSSAGVAGAGAVGASPTAENVTTTGTATETPEVTTGTASPTITATATATPGGSIEEVRRLLARGSWSEGEASLAYGAIRRADLTRLDDGRARELYRRLLERLASADVPEDVIRQAADRVGSDARSISERVAEGLPPGTADRLASRLGELGGWATELKLSAISGFSDSTVTATPGETVDRGANRSEKFIEVGRNVDVTDWGFQDGTFSVTVEADIPTRVVVSDALGPVVSEGATRVPQRSVFVEDRRVIQMTVQSFEGAAAVSVGTSSGAVYLSTGVTESNPFRYFGGTSGLFSGVFLSMMLSIGATSFVLWREESGVIKA